jgi:hypothetical protein
VSEREVAQTILRQIGTNNRMAVGARDPVAFGPRDGEGLGVDARRGGGVMFRVGAGRPFQKVIIGLRADDTYDVRYISAPTATASLNPVVDVRKHGIYAENLGEVVYDLVNKGEHRLKRGHWRSQIPGVTHGNPGWSIPGVSNGLTRRSSRPRYAGR